jgi:bifunctional non-homologous end joining protein LigD
MRTAMSSRFGPLPAGFVPPCLPTGSKAPPTGKQWLHEIKHDGFRIIARKQDNRVKLYSRPGNDLTRRFPLIVETVAQLRVSSCIVDGEAVACGEDGITCFELLRRWDISDGAFMYASDLIGLDGDDFRHHPLRRDSYSSRPPDRSQSASKRASNRTSTPLVHGSS